MIILWRQDSDLAIRPSSARSESAATSRFFRRRVGCQELAAPRARTRHVDNSRNKGAPRGEIGTLNLAHGEIGSGLAHAFHHRRIKLPHNLSW